MGLTRAKRALFVVGSMSTLEKGKYGYRSPASSVTGYGDEEVDMVRKRMNRGAQAWRNYAQFLAGQKLVLQLRGQDLAKVLRPYSRSSQRFEVEEQFYT